MQEKHAHQALMPPSSQKEVRNTCGLPHIYRAVESGDCRSHPVSPHTRTPQPGPLGGVLQALRGWPTQ